MPNALNSFLNTVHHSFRQNRPKPMMRGERATYAHLEEHQQNHQDVQHHHDPMQPIYSPTESLDIVQLHQKFQSELDNGINLQPITQHYLLDDLQTQRRQLIRQQTMDSNSTVSSTSTSSPEIRQGSNLKPFFSTALPTAPTRSISGPIRKYAKTDNEWPNSPSSSYPNYITDSSSSSTVVRNSFLPPQLGNLTGSTINPMWCEQQQQQQQQIQSSPSQIAFPSSNMIGVGVTNADPCAISVSNPVEEYNRPGPSVVQNVSRTEHDFNSTTQRWLSIDQFQVQQHQQQLQQQHHHLQEQRRLSHHRRTVSSSDHLLRSFPIEFQPNQQYQFSTTSSPNPTFTSTTAIANISSSRPTLSRTRSHRSEVDREEANRQKSKRHYDRKKDQRTALADLTAHLVHVVEQVQNFDQSSCQSETFKELLNALQFRLPLPAELANADGKIPSPTMDKDGKMVNMTTTMGNPIKRANERKRLNKLMQRHLEMQRIQQLSFAAKALEPSLHLAEIMNLMRLTTSNETFLFDQELNRDGEIKAIFTLLQAWIRCPHAWPHLLLAEERLSLIAGRPLARMITSLRSATSIE